MKYEDGEAQKFCKVTSVNCLLLWCLPKVKGVLQREQLSQCLPVWLLPEFCPSGQLGTPLTFASINMYNPAHGALTHTNHSRSVLTRAGLRYLPVEEHKQVFLQKAFFFQILPKS